MKPTCIRRYMAEKPLDLRDRLAGYSTGHDWRDVEDDEVRPVNVLASAFLLALLMLPLFVFVAGSLGWRVW